MEQLLKIIFGIVIYYLWGWFAYMSSQLKRKGQIGFLTIMFVPIVAFILPFIKNNYLLNVTNSYLLIGFTLIITGWVLTLKNASEEDRPKWFALIFLIPILALIYWFVKD